MSGGPARRPRGRRDNGLHARSYVPLEDVDPRVGEHLLDVLYLAGIAAYLTPSLDTDVVTRAASLPSHPSDRIWVDKTRRVDARELLRAEAAAAGRDGVVRRTEDGAEDKPAARGAGERSGNPAGAFAGGADPALAAAFAAIVADFDRSYAEPVGRWSAAEDLDDPAPDHAATDRAGLDRADLDEPVPDRPDLGEPDLDEPVPDRPDLGEPATDRVAPDGADLDGADLDRPGRDRADLGGPALHKPAREDPAQEDSIRNYSGFNDSVHKDAYIDEAGRDLAGAGSTDTPTGRAADADRAEQVASDPRSWTPADEPEQDERFVPPAPPPLPHISRGTAAALVIMVIGLVLFLFPGLLGLSGDLALAVPIGALVVGVVILICRMYDGPPVDDGPDDGAVV